MLSPSYSILKFKDQRGLAEVAHYEPPHQDLRCLQIQLFSFLVLKELNNIKIDVMFGVIHGCNGRSNKRYFRSYQGKRWLVGWLFWVLRPFETVFQSISGRLPKRGRKRREKDR